MKLLLTLTLAVLPLPLLVWALRSGHYRRCLPAFVAVAGIYGFTCVGAGKVIYTPDLYTDAYFYSMLVVIACCYAFYAILIGIGQPVMVDYSRADRDPSLTLFAVTALPLWAVSCWLLALYISRHGLPPIFALAGGLDQYVDLYAVRAEKTTRLTEGAHWYILGLQVIPYLLFAYSYVLWLQHRTWGMRLVFVATTVLTLAFATSFANKDILLHLVLIVLITRIYWRGTGLSFRQVSLYGAVAVSSVFLFYRLYLLDRSAGAVLSVFGNYLAERLLFIYAEGHAFLVKIIPLQQPFFDGRALANPGGLLPYTPVDISIFLGDRALGTQTNWSTPSFTIGYANFGFPGIFLVLGAMAVQVIALQLLFRRMPRTPFFLALYALLTERMIKYGSESLQNVFSEEVVVVLLGAVLWHLLVVRELHPIFGRLLPRMRGAPAEDSAPAG
jgi:hypothetical protein